MSVTTELVLTEAVAVQHRPAGIMRAGILDTPLTDAFKCYNGSNPGIIMGLLERQGKQPFSVVIFPLFLFAVLNKSFPSLNLISRLQNVFDMGLKRLFMCLILQHIYKN